MRNHRRFERDHGSLVVKRGADRWMKYKGGGYHREIILRNIVQNRKSKDNRRPEGFTYDNDDDGAGG